MQALRTRRKRKPDQVVKRGTEFTLGSTGLCSEGCEQIWGRGSGSHRPGKAAPQRGMSECRGHEGDAPGVQDKEARREGAK